jgi:hypothetical protein
VIKDMCDEETAIDRVATDGRGELVATLLHFPNPTMHPSPQYAFVNSHQPGEGVSTYSLR